MSDRQDDRASKRRKHMAVMDDRRAEPLEPSNTYPPHASKGFPEVPMSEIDTSPEAVERLAQRAAWAAPSEVAATLRALSAKMEAAEAEVARLKALLEANDAWAVGEPSKPPRATLQGSKEEAPERIWAYTGDGMGDRMTDYGTWDTGDEGQPDCHPEWPHAPYTRADLPPTLADALAVPEVKALVVKARQAIEWCDRHDKEPDWVEPLWEAIAALEKVKDG